MLGIGFGIYIAARKVGVVLSLFYLQFFAFKNSKNHKFKGLLILFLITSLLATFVSIILFILNQRYIKNKTSQVERYRKYIEKHEKYRNDT